MASSGWCTIESDPGVFTELISKFGVKGLQVEELWDLEEATFERLRGNVHGLVFLFKWDKDLQTAVAESTMEAVPSGLFFAKQMINNACATQAILNILLNCDDSVALGDTLTNFRKFSGSLDPESAGMALEQCDAIRVAHNSFSRPEPIHIEHDADDKEEDAFHFISYVPKTGVVYELDGLQKAPRRLGALEHGEKWWDMARATIQRRMAEYSGGELRFTLLALTNNLKDVYTDELAQIGSATDEESVARRGQLTELVADEKAKFDRWRKANIRRRHNYFPFIFEMLKMLAQNNVLGDITERAVEKKAAKVKAEEEAEAAKKKSEAEADTDADKDKGKDTDKDADVEMAEAE